eukprot:snap_masked-scaffold_3-processed-gene-8.36-mRNA-1 protein AED:1.00 eAED:1.00 QI:0/0/0/0/1/1/2/0/69
MKLMTMLKQPDGGIFIKTRGAQKFAFKNYVFKSRVQEGFILKDIPSRKGFHLHNFKKLVHNWNSICSRS